MSQPLSPELEQRAHRLQAGADLLCDVRSETAPILFGYIVAKPNYRSWPLAAVVGSYFASDKLDGIWARRAAQILGTEPTPEGAKKDERADKRLCHAIFAGIAIREALNGNKAYATLLGGSDVAMALRDHIVSGYRDRGAELGIDGKARAGGKIKLATLAVTATYAVSPLAEPDNLLGPTGPLLASVGTLAGAALSIHSGLDQIQHQQEQLQLLLAQQTTGA